MYMTASRQMPAKHALDGGVIVAYPGNVLGAGCVVLTAVPDPDIGIALASGGGPAIQAASSHRTSREAATAQGKCTTTCRKH